MQIGAPFLVSTPAPLPPPGPLALTPATGSIPDVPAVPYGTYRLDSGDRVRVIMFGQDNLSRVYSVEVETYRPFFILGEVHKPGQYPYVNAMTVEAAVAIAEGYTERAKKRVVRLTRRFGGVMSTVMVPTDYPVQPGDTIYVLERFF